MFYIKEIKVCAVHNSRLLFNTVQFSICSHTRQAEHMKNFKRRCVFRSMPLMLKVRRSTVMMKMARNSIEFNLKESLQKIGREAQCSDFDLVVVNLTTHQVK